MIKDGWFALIIIWTSICIALGMAILWLVLELIWKWSPVMVKTIA